MATRNWIARSSVALLAGCAALSWMPPARAADGPADKTFELKVVGLKAEGGARTVRAARGDRVAIRVTSDRKLTVHLHGYDVHAEVGPGSPATVAFHAQWAGRFPVTAHLPDAKRGGHHGTEPTLMYLEIRPK